MKASFRKRDRLKLRNEIELTFNEGSFFIAYPFKVFYRALASDKVVSNQIALSVSKRRLRKAVERNLVKRLIRETYRANNFVLKTFSESNQLHFQIVFVYIADEVVPLKVFIKGMMKTFSELCKRNTV